MEIELLCLIQTSTTDAEQMSKRKNKKQKYKKNKVRPVMPAKKPDASHMPICSTLDCKRHVSDARKTKCARCGSTTLYSQYTNIYGAYE